MYKEMLLTARRDYPNNINSNNNRNTISSSASSRIR